MPRGIDLCKENVQHSIDDARILIKEATTRSSGHPIASIVFAIEELGKAKVLDDCLQMAEKKGVAEAKVKEGLFRGRCAHEWKFQEGKSQLSPDSLVIVEAAFQPDAFQSDAFQTSDIVLEDRIRPDATFVDWSQAEKKWKIGAPADPEKIENIASEIERALKKL
jgi:hypothetical protein